VKKRKNLCWTLKRLKITLWTRRRWLTPVILATQEAEVRKIPVGSQLQQKVCKTLSQKHLIHKKADRVAQVIESLSSEHETLSSSTSTVKNKEQKKTSWFWKKR
jgi:hypothetical protein